MAVTISKLLNRQSLGPGKCIGFNTSVSAAAECCCCCFCYRRCCVFTTVEVYFSTHLRATNGQACPHETPTDLVFIIFSLFFLTRKHVNVWRNWFRKIESRNDNEKIIIIIIKNPRTRYRAKRRRVPSGFGGMVGVVVRVAVVRVCACVCVARAHAREWERERERVWVSDERMSEESREIERQGVRARE
jgi:hypothetical protein